MTTPQLIEYVRQQRAAHASQDAVRTALMSQGWSSQDIDEAFAAVSDLPHAPQTPQTLSPAVVRVSVDPSPQQVVSAPVVQQPAVMQPLKSAQTSHAKHFGLLFVFVGLLLSCVVAGGVAFAYVQKMGPFAHAPYTQENLLSGLLRSFSRINSSTYALSGSLAVVPRDADAVPFVMVQKDNTQLKAAYARDAQRGKDVMSILSALRLKNKAYPPTIDASSLRSYAGSVSVKDPLTGRPYVYELVGGGAHFHLQVTFETSDAIVSIKKIQKFATTEMVIDDKAVTFTDKSYPYIYLESEPPKPFFVQLQEAMQYIPSQISATLSVGATSDWKAENADWKFNADATADLGDLSFKVNADVLKKDSMYYFRINNIPSLFGNSLSSLKGKWVSVDPAASSTWSKGYSEYSALASSLPKAEQNYKLDRAQAVEFLTKMIAIADEEHLYVFASSPRSERVDGTLLYRYDLQLNKNALLPFYRKTVALDQTYSKTPLTDMFDDSGVLAYLQSEEFDRVFEYYQKNTTMTLWVDAQGYPAILQTSVRIVPPDTAFALKDKQIRVVYKLVFSDINQSVNIVVPHGAEPIGDVIKREGATLGF